MEVQLLVRLARGNVSWIVADRVVRLLIAFVMGALVARHLGPDAFGVLSLSVAYAGIFAAFSTFGLEPLVVSALAQNEEGRGRIIGTSLVIRAAGSLLAVVFSAILAAVLRNDLYVVFLTVISSAVFVAQVGFVFDWLAQADHRVWISALSKTVAAVISALLKLVLIWADAGPALFAVAALIEAFLASAVMIFIFKIKKTETKYLFDFALAKTMLRDTGPLLISGIAFYIYTQMDVVMLGYMTSDVQVGNYTAATKISEAISFLPLAIVMVEFPKWAKLKANDGARYAEKVSEDFVRIIGTSVILSLGLSLSGGFIGPFIYGDDFALVGSLLTITAWISALSVWGFASSRLIILENQSRQIVYRNLAGILVNFCGNLILIPKFGAFGSAYATIASYFTANVLFYASSRKLRPLFGLLLASIGATFRPSKWRII